MTAKILELIDKVDVSEVIRDQIAGILVVESANQQVLAAEATPTPKDPRLWALRVFVERSNPWAEYQDAPAQLDATPIVNVSVDSGEYDRSASNVVERQKTAGTFNIDCYGYGISAAAGGGHDPGDARASLEAQRAYRLVRNILMSGQYTYLGLTRGVVGRRWPLRFQVFKPQAEDHNAIHVIGLRLQLEVTFNEFSPQVQGEPLETISAQLKRAETGEVYLTETLTPS